jgi:hypothetical protein
MKHGGQCVFCDASPEHGHEVWEYNDHYTITPVFMWTQSHCTCQSRLWK